MLEKDGTPGKRQSLDGHQKLQEVFERAQRDSKDLEGDAANVDWGEYSSSRAYYSAHVCVAFWGGVVSGMRVQPVTYFILTRGWEDYQGFASENSERLARAIERGIPSKLRGMVWQLM